MSMRGSVVGGMSTPLKRNAERIDEVVEATQFAIDEALEQVLEEQPAKPIRRLSELLRDAAAEELFTMLDTNEDGALSLKEARAGLQGQVQPSALRVVFDAYDADDSGSFDVEEFKRLCRSFDTRQAWTRLANVKKLSQAQRSAEPAVAARPRGAGR